MLTVKCQGCGAVYKLSEDLYSRKAAGFGVVVTCRRCRTEIHVESADGANEPAPANSSAAAETQTAPVVDAVPLVATKQEPSSPVAADANVTAEPKAAVAVAPKAAPLPPRATPKATAPWPEAPVRSPPAPAVTPPIESVIPLPDDEALTLPPAAPVAVAPAALAAPEPALPVEAPKVEVKAALPRGESPSPPRAAPVEGHGFPRPAPRPAAPAAKPAKRDPVSGPFVALSPGLLGANRPAPLPPDSEAPIDSSDFLEESRKGAPKAPPARRPVPDKPPPPKADAKASPARRAEGALPLKIKEPPKPPQHKPRAPMRSDDVSADLLSADVGFEGAPPVDVEAPRLVAPDTSALAEAPRLVAPDASALAAPPVSERKPTRESTKGDAAAPSTSDASPRPSSSGKSSRVLPLVLLGLGAVGAFALAFRSQLPGNEAPAPAPEKPAANEPVAASPLPPLPPPIEPAAPPAAEPGATTAPAPSAAPNTATPKPGATTATAAARPTEPKPGSAPVATSAASSTPKPAITAAAPGAAEPSDAPRGKPEGPFNAEAARTALAGAVAQASGCRKPGDPSGVAAVTITFSPSGRVTSATIAGPPFAGTPTGGCIAATLRRARVPAFEGEMVTVRKTVEIQ